jgi:membrane-associated phospholipid phosphatase
MTDVTTWGLEAIRYLQQFKSDPLTAVMLGISFLGSAAFYLALVPILYWCVNERKAIRIGLFIFFSAFLSLWLKDSFKEPRPFALDPQVELSHESTYAFPSAHAQNSLTFWGLLAYWVKRPWAIVAAVAMPLLIGLSRVYLGVHYPTDVLAGWGIAAIILLGNALIAPRLKPYFEKLPTRALLIITALLSWVFCWLHMQDISAAAAFCGAGVGYVLMKENIGFTFDGKLWKKAAGTVIGFAGLAVIMFGIKAISPQLPTQENYNLFRFLRYGMAGAWVTLGAPWAFVQLKLAESQPRKREAPENTEHKEDGNAN